MRDSSELKKRHERWSAEVSNKIKKIPNEVERLRLVIEAEKVTMLSEIAQGFAFYYESQ